MAYDLIARLKLVDKFSGPMAKAERATKSLQRATAQASKAAGNMGGNMRHVHNNAEKAAGSMHKMSNHAKHASHGIWDMYTGMLKMSVVMGMVAATAAPLVGTFMAVKKGLQLSSEAEQASIAFETMLGSADKSRKFLADLADFANKTPFELPQLRDASKRMLAFGFSADSILPTLTAVGNAAAGLGLGSEGIDRITLALGQMRAKSKVSGDEMLQLTEAGIPAWEILAKKMNVTTAAVMKMSEKGIIPADKAIKALIDGMNQRFPDMMAKQSRSLRGLWSTMKDTFNNKLLVKFGDGIASALKPRFDAIVTWINANGATIDRWAAKLQSFAGKVTDSLARAATSVFNWFQRLNSDENFQALTWDQKLVEVIKRAFDAMNTWLTSNDEAINKMAAAFAAVGIKLGAAFGSAIINGLMETLKTNPIAAALVGAAVGAAVGSVIPGAGTLAGGIVGGTSGFLANMLHQNSPFVKGEKYQSNVYRFIQNDKNSDPNKPYLGETTLSGTPPKKAGGLDRVPYNGFPAILHKDERVQTKAEADATRNGRGRGGFTLNKIADTVIVREDADIDRIIDGIVRKLDGLQGAVAN